MCASVLNRDGYITHQIMETIDKIWYHKNRLHYNFEFYLVSCLLIDMKVEPRQVDKLVFLSKL